VMALIYGMRAVVEAAPETAPESWQRFLDIHLAGLRSPAAFTDRAGMWPGPTCP